MKLKYLKAFRLFLFVTAFVFTSCKKDGPFTVIKSNNSILINGSVNNLTIPGGIAAGAGAIAAFDVVVGGSDATSVTISNRYTLSGSSVIVERLIGNYPVSGGKASIPAIPISVLRNPSDPLITATGNAGTNTLLIDALLNNGTQERRIFGTTLANSVVILDGDIYKVALPSSPTAGVPSYTVVVNSTGLNVRVTTRYVLPDQSTPANYTLGSLVVPSTAVDAITRSAVIPSMTVAQMRSPSDPQITGLSNVGQQFVQVEVLGAPTVRTGTVTASTNSATVTGVGTTFTVQLAVGNLIYDTTGTTLIGIVQSIETNTSLTLTTPAVNAATAAGYATHSAALTTKIVNVTW